jgi:hypothetical protein
MRATSISFLPLLILLTLLSPSSSWCYKSFFPLQGEASSVDISPDSAYMAITSIPQNIVQIYDLINYNLLFNYVPASGTVAAARFTNDGIYLGIGLSNGIVNLISGRVAFNSSVLITFTVAGSISDMDFNSNNNKLLVCYSNQARYDIINNYTGNGLPLVQKTVSNNVQHCQFSANDDIGLIDTNKRIQIYRASNNAVSTSITTNANFKNFDIRQTTTTPIKFIAAGNDTKGYFAFDTNPSGMTLMSLTYTSSLSNGVMTPACYSGDGLYYAFGGGGNDQRIFLYYDNDTIASVFNDAISTTYTLT